MDHKLMRANTYKLGRRSNWHCFMDSLADFVIVVWTLSGLALLVLIATITIWA